MIRTKLKGFFLGGDFPEEYRTIYKSEQIFQRMNQLKFFNLTAAILGIIYIAVQYLTHGRSMFGVNYSIIIVTATGSAVFFTLIFFIFSRKYGDGNKLIAAFIMLFFISVSAIAAWVSVFQSITGNTESLIFLFVVILSAILLCFDMLVNTLILTFQEIMYIGAMFFFSSKIEYLNEGYGNIINSVFVLILSYYILFVINSMKRKNFTLGESIKEKMGIIENAVNIDPLTGVMNRRAFDRYVPSELDRCKKAKLIFAVMIMDVDDFTAYNDAFGLLQGDYCLIKIATAIQKSLSRSTDKLFRFNSKQFALIFPGADAHGCEVVSARVLNVVRDLQIDNEDGPYGIVTVSIGAFTEEMNASSKITPSEIINLTAKALDKAKNSGKNTFAIHNNNDQAK